MNDPTALISTETPITKYKDNYIYFVEKQNQKPYFSYTLYNIELISDNFVSLVKTIIKYEMLLGG